MKLTCPNTFTTPHPKSAKNSFMEDVEETIIVSAALTTARKSAKVGISIAFQTITSSSLLTNRQTEGRLGLTD